MLTGRESLIRVIGKRRRNLSSPSFFLLSDNAKKGLSSSSLSTMWKEEEELMDQQRGTSCDDFYSNLDCVTCPVCGNNVRAMSYLVNSHLDACLIRGTKRKLTQRTLLEFSFNPRSDDRVVADKDDNLEEEMSPMKSENDYELSAVLLSPKNGSSEKGRRNECTAENSYILPNILGTCSSFSVENSNVDGIMKDKKVEVCGSTSSLCDFKTIEPVAVNGDFAGKALVTLETYVVGRKFADDVILNQEASISLLRDPKNVKDMNAIKVIHSDSKCQTILGFLPRELAKYLSPLIDKFYLNFEGLVTNIPTHPLDVIPVKLFCKEMGSFNEMESDYWLFQSLWKNAVLVAENAKSSSLNMTKYQHNFHLLIQEVLKQHSHLFTNDEKQFLEAFNLLSDDSQRLFVRLYTRKGPWFRMSSISYPEISDIQQAVQELCAAGFLCSLKSIEYPSKSYVNEVLDLLTVPEIRGISSVVSPKKGIHCMRKPDLVGMLFSAYKNETCPLIVDMIMERTGTCVRISSTSEFLFWRTQRLFFLNGEQDLSSFLLVDMGLVKYPLYTCRISGHIFSTRLDLLAYEEAIEVAQIMDQSLDENNIDFVIRCIELSNDRIDTSSIATHSSISEPGATFLSCFSASWVYSKVVTLGISFYERERRYENAIELLKNLLNRFTCDGRRGYWTLRLSVDLEHKGLIDDSLSVAEKGVTDPWVRAGIKLALQRRVVRLGKPPRRWKTPSFAKSIDRKINEVHVMGRPLNCEIGMKNRYYGDDGEQCGVEQLALQYYAAEGGRWQGMHAENGIWMTIFGIIMWDVLFADVADVFRTSFQTAPLDLDTDSFYTARKSNIESLLDKVYSGLAEEMLITSWESHFGTACRGVDWERHSLSELRAIVSCISGPCLASLCRYLAQDYRSWSRGMPDLLLWRLSGDYGGGDAKLVEVKGPRDRLSEQQRAWLLLLMDCGFNVEVCKVSPVPADD